MDRREILNTHIFLKTEGCERGSYFLYAGSFYIWVNMVVSILFSVPERSLL
jgi:hypothetical protein